MDLEMYEEIYDRYFRLARKIANDILNDYYLAGDVCQEVFTDMLMKKDMLNEEDIKFWIVLNTNRKALDQKRRIYRKMEVGMGISSGQDWEVELEFEDCGGNVPEDFVIRKEKAEYRRTVLEELREYNADWYEMLMRSQVGGESYKSLARSFGINEINLRVQMHRARKWMERRLHDLYEE